MNNIGFLSIQLTILQGHVSPVNSPVGYRARLTKLGVAIVVSIATRFLWNGVVSATSNWF